MASRPPSRVVSTPTDTPKTRLNKLDVVPEGDAGVLHKGPSSKVRGAINSFLSLLSSGVKKDYAIERAVLGKGKFGQVRLGTHRKTGKKCAIKIMQKQNKDEKELRLMLREIDIMKNVAHPNCIEFYGMYESRHSLYIVMELVTGGQLLDRIIQKDHYSETEAAHVFVQMISAIDYLHSVGIVHRDLKPENILYATPAADSPIKIVDFGLGKLVELKELEAGRIRLWSRCGSPNYVAPEILLRKGYGMECDVWSAGVILFISLSGAPPFDQTSVEKKFQHIKKASFGFPEPQWNGISDEVKDLICHMLCLEVKERYSCKQCLEHAWCKRFQSGTLPREGMPQMQVRLKEWNAQRKLMAAIHTCTALGRMAHACTQPNQEECAERLAQLKLDPTRLAELRESFDLLDRDHQGGITVESLARCMQAVGQRKNEAEVREMMQQFSIFQQDQISFEEYCIMMCPHPEHAEHALSPHRSQHGPAAGDEAAGAYSEEEVLQTFQALDLHRTGLITPQALKEVLTRFGSTVSDEEAVEMVRTADTKGDGFLDLEEFRHLLHLDHSQSVTSPAVSRRSSATVAGVPLFQRFSSCP